MSRVVVDGTVTVNQLPPVERELLDELRAAVNAALAAGIDPNHALSLIGALMVKTAVTCGMPLENLEDLQTGLGLTIAHEREKGTRSGELPS